MGLKDRPDSYYVNFRVIDDGKTLSLASPGEGKAKLWKVGCHNKAEAKKQEAIIKTKLLAGTLKSSRAAQTAVTFSAWGKQYVEIDEVKRLRSYHERCQRIERILVPFFGRKFLTEITVKDIDDWRRERSKGRAVATVNVDHNLLKHMLKHAMRRDLVMRNVACLVAAPEPDNRRDRVLSADEWERLYNAAPEWFKPVLLTGYHTGMRLEEILSLTWDRVDLTKNRIYLPGHLTKTGKPREVPLTATLGNCLAQHRERDGISRIQGLVFERDRQKLNHTYRLVQQICKEQRIENFRFHDLRHCAVTKLAEIGIETETIMRIVGHSSVEMFLRYRSVKPEHLDAAMKRLNSALGTVMAPPSTAVK